MKTSLDYLDEMKAKQGLPSDYAAANVLGVSRAAVSAYRVGRNQFDNLTAAKVAELLGIDAMEVIAAVNYERAKDEHTRALWLSLWEKSGGKYREEIERVRGWRIGSPIFQGEGLW
jgi:predicted transcriptional regulator